VRHPTRNVVQALLAGPTLLEITGMILIVFGFWTQVRLILQPSSRFRSRYDQLMRARDDGTFYQLKLIEQQLYEMRGRMSLFFLLSVYGQLAAIHDSVLEQQRRVVNSYAYIDSTYESVSKAEKDYARAGADKLWLYCLVTGTLCAGASRVWRVVRDDLHKPYKPVSGDRPPPDDDQPA
jgi:hypothetical protein